jgi:cytochrome c-type biogenesis protein CcmH/NrfF
VAIAFVLMVVALIATPGLGVVAIIAVPVALVLIGTVIAERRLRRRRQATARTPRRPARR